MLTVGVCEDDPAIRRVLTQSLRYAGHEAVLAHTGAEALRLFGADAALDVVIMDIGLPDSDGRDVCQALKSAGQHAPVLFLTALGAVHDKLAGFSAGGDDYLSKPFEVKELLARLEVLGRRTPTSVGATGLVLDPVTHSVRSRGRRGPADPDRVPDAGRDHVAPRRGRTATQRGRGRLAGRRRGQREHHRLVHAPAAHQARVDLLPGRRSRPCAAWGSVSADATRPPPTGGVPAPPAGRAERGR